MEKRDVNLLVVLGPTASGKTRLGVDLARLFGGEIVSADSRQVYRGLDIGSGKDLDEYSEGGPPVPYHLIDIVSLDEEFNVFEYQRRFFEVFEGIGARHVLPVLVGGTGLYIESVLSGYRMVEVPEDAALRAELEPLSQEALVDRLLGVKPDVHNTTDFGDRGRLVRAIEIAVHSRDREPEPTPEVRPFILGTRWPRETLRARIRQRLEERLEGGMIEEVQGLVENGVPWEKLEFLGLEYRHVAALLRGDIHNRNDFVQKLGSAIGQFARRQESWFRRMERRGATIHWIDRGDTAQAVDAVARGTGLVPSGR
ncbi:MAG: tRNA (adenosine(37)-N6)-dimethylallyltransferase MiaA [bacterium]|nr:tRNA (adenosine(37)-N6)-dimethylallyltransferase MiaA [bacterium]